MQKIEAIGNQKWKMSSKTIIPQFYGLLNQFRNAFLASPRVIFNTSSNFLVTCRHQDSTFTIYDLNKFCYISSIAFHLVFFIILLSIRIL